MGRKIKSKCKVLKLKLKYVRKINEMRARKIQESHIYTDCTK